jgi:hypothetical protein
MQQESPSRRPRTAPNGLCVPADQGAFKCRKASAERIAANHGVGASDIRSRARLQKLFAAVRGAL